MILEFLGDSGFKRNLELRGIALASFSILDFVSNLSQKVEDALVEVGATLNPDWLRREVGRKY